MIVKIDADTAIAWLEKVDDMIQDQKDDLTKMDQETGDGDHGINMARGFSAVRTKIKEESYSTAGAVFKDAAMTLMSKIGGASGPLYGTAFLRMATACQDTDPVDQQTFAKALQAATDGMKQRGKAEVGEKTMIDVWDPVTNYLLNTSIADSDAIKKTAADAMEATKPMIATKGRAAYFKERSKGAIDPGAASSCFIFTALAEVLKGVQ